MGLITTLLLWLISDYRSVACANVLYKVISKILCNKIKWFLPFLIAENQSYFIPGRNVGENVLLAHEQVLDFAKRGKAKMCIKIDLQKAYDTVNCEFVCHMLHCFAFSLSTIQLIYECISTPTFFIMADGRPEEFITSNRGLQQEDPLSSFLFCIAMEFFALLMEEGVADQKLEPINKFEPNISHLLYTDDVMIFLAYY